MKTLKLFSILFVSISLLSCNKDKSGPTITVAQPANHSHHSLSGMLHIEATFEDDVDLKSYSIFIGDVEGNHTHDFHYMTDSTISGKSHEFHEHTMIPDSLNSMEYYIHFNVTDAADKVTSEAIMIHVM
jgi:hypothetical protein